ncbi:hypothetical protein Dsin_028000 [Dipteronia sinensis]|uniref:Plant heme peroxidase family profile domain-containing protein n=1 Tax=Dipteronia sinensis TaxID=43782 RepID=A0AAE0DU60_9ROSI|nr:hypothetical protein Dsin_028000 [Dipteronia sinensis]
MYLKCGNADVAFRIFERIQDKDVVPWTAMIPGLVQNDCANKTLFVFCEMLKSKAEPYAATIASVLAACAQLGSLDFGTSIHGYIIRQGMTLVIPAQNSLVTLFAKYTIALVARESVAFSGGPEIQIPLGRKDSRTSNHQQADIHLPTSGISVDEFLHIFMSKGMNL